LQTARGRALLILAVVAIAVVVGRVVLQGDSAISTEAPAPLLDAAGVPLPVLDYEALLPVGEPYALEVGTHCGVARLGLPVNGEFWLTDEADGARGAWMPPEWSGTSSGGLLAVELVLSADGTELTVSRGGRSVSYRPVTESDPVRPCA